MAPALRGLSSLARTKFVAAGQIGRAPAQAFEWKLRKGADESPAKEFVLFIFNNVTGEIQPFPSALSRTIWNVKQTIAEHGFTKIPLEHMKLVWNGRVLEDKKTIVSYGIQNQQCLHVSRNATQGTGVTHQGTAEGARRHSAVALTVCLVADNMRPTLARLQFCARRTDKVADVKRQIEEQTGVAVVEQRLSFSGRTIANELSLEDCGVEDDVATLQLVFPFPTGLELPLTELERCTNYAAPSANVQRVSFPVTVREVWPKGRSRKIFILADLPVREIKGRLAALCGIAPEDQVLVNRGRILDSELTASYYNLEGGAVLELGRVGGVSPVPILPPLVPQSARGGESSQRARPTCVPETSSPFRVGGRMQISAGLGTKQFSSSTLAPNASVDTLKEMSLDTLAAGSSTHTAYRGH